MVAPMPFCSGLAAAVSKTLRFARWIALARRLVRSETSGCGSPKIGVARLFSACWQCVTIVCTASLLATSPCASPPIPSDSTYKLQRGLDLVTIFVVFSDAPKVGARAGLNAQKGPHSAGSEVAWVSKAVGG